MFHVKHQGNSYLGHKSKPRRQRQNRAPDVGEDAGSSFWDTISPISPEEWRQGYSLYLYRCEPITDKRITGKEIFIKKIFQCTDPRVDHRKRKGAVSISPSSTTWTLLHVKERPSTVTTSRL